MAFTPRLTRPTAGNKYYISLSKGGYNNAIQGKPTDSQCDVLSNCVGYANGRFAEIAGKNKVEYQLVCNAENFVEKAKSYGLIVSDKPKLGAIMCWQKGNTLSGSDGAGHVAVVEKIIGGTEVITSESVYNGSAFFTKTRKKGTDGRWGENSNFTFRGFILNPAVTDESIIPEPSERNKTVNQIYVDVTNLRIRTAPNLGGKIIGFAKKGYYNYTDIRIADNYLWYKISKDKWIAYDSKWASLYPVALKAGDKARMAKDAPVYGTSKKFFKFVYDSELFVRSVNGNKILVSLYSSGDVTGHVDRKYLIKI